MKLYQDRQDCWSEKMSSWGQVERMERNAPSRVSHLIINPGGCSGRSAVGMAGLESIDRRLRNGVGILPLKLLHENWMYAAPSGDASGAYHPSSPPQPFLLTDGLIKKTRSTTLGISIRLLGHHVITAIIPGQPVLC